MGADERIADFENPPVAEVVLGCHFSMANLSPAHLGAFWETVRGDYPIIEEANWVQPIRVGGLAAALSVTPQLQGAPIRLFLVKEDQCQLLQLQRDRFHANWRSANGLPAKYPRYPEIKSTFFSRWEQFLSFCRADSKLGPISDQQFEMTYVNHIIEEERTGGLDTLATVFPWIRPSFLNSGADVNLVFRSEAAECAGEIAMAIRSGIHTQTQARLLVFELTVRGRAEQDFGEWSDLARKRIVTTFVQSTSEDIQKKVWGKK